MLAKGLNSDPRRPILALYLAVDVSSSMEQSGAIAEASGLFPSFVNAVSSLLDTDMVRFGLIDFSDDARVVVPLTDIRDIQSVPTLSARGGTSYAALFRLLRTQLATDERRMRADGHEDFRPVVLLVTDGPPTDDEHVTSAAFRQLVSDEFAWRMTIAAFGIEQATTDELDKWVFPPIGHAKAIGSRMAGPNTDISNYMTEIIVAQVDSLGGEPGSGTEATGRPPSGSVPPDEDDLPEWVDRAVGITAGSEPASTDAGTIGTGGDDELRWAVPHYLVIDTSSAKSEAEATELLASVWDRTCGSLRITMQDIHLTSIISFGRDAILVIPLSRDSEPIRLAPIPNLPGPPFWAPVFNLLRRRMRGEMAALKLCSHRLYRPRVFLFLLLDRRTGLANMRPHSAKRCNVDSNGPLMPS